MDTKIIQSDYQTKEVFEKPESIPSSPRFLRSNIIVRVWSGITKKADGKHIHSSLFLPTFHFFKKTVPSASPPNYFCKEKKEITYNNVCRKLFIFFVLQKCKLQTILDSMYVMLCYVIEYSIYLSIHLLGLIVYKLSGITYCMLCYSRGCCSE